MNNIFQSFILSALILSAASHAAPSPQLDKIWEADATAMQAPGYKGVVIVHFVLSDEEVAAIESKTTRGSRLAVVAEILKAKTEKLQNDMKSLSVKIKIESIQNGTMAVTISGVDYAAAVKMATLDYVARIYANRLM